MGNGLMKKNESRLEYKGMKDESDCKIYLKNFNKKVNRFYFIFIQDTKVYLNCFNCTSLTTVITSTTIVCRDRFFG